MVARRRAGARAAEIRELPAAGRARHGYRRRGARHMADAKTEHKFGIHTFWKLDAAYVYGETAQGDRRLPVAPWTAREAKQHF